MTIIKPGGPQPIMYFVIFSKKTAFLKLEDVFPECFVQRADSPQLEPLICLLDNNSCHANNNCMEKLVKRLHVLFEEVLTNVDMILLYYRQRFDPSSIGSGVFWRNLQDFKVVTLNKSAWSMIKNRGTVLQFQPSATFFLGGTTAAPQEAETTDEISLD